jgi:hypothetical protein
MRYLLPCECGRQIPIATSQAGETLSCECGRSPTAPKLRELRQLPAAPDSDAPPPSRGAWTRQQGVVFASGLILFLLGATIFGVTWFQRSTLRTEPPRIVPELLAAHLAEVDRNTPLQNLEIWQHEILEEGLQREDDPPFVVHRRVAIVLKWIGVAGGVASALGLAMMAVALLSRPAVRPRSVSGAKV